MNENGERIYSKIALIKSLREHFPELGLLEAKKLGEKLAAEVPDLVAERQRRNCRTDLLSDVRDLLHRYDASELDSTTAVQKLAVALDNYWTSVESTYISE